MSVFGDETRAADVAMSSRPAQRRARLQEPDLPSSAASAPAARRTSGVSNTVAELIALAQPQPGVRYATGSGMGSPQHRAIQWFAQIVGVKLEQVPYRGGGQAINDLLGGHVHFGSPGSTAVDPALQGGHAAPAGANLP
jgi:tripartite-type tricarboxylate transporter receptor subunit TctC